MKRKESILLIYYNLTLNIFFSLLFETFHWNLTKREREREREIYRSWVLGLLEREWWDVREEG